MCVILVVQAAEEGAKNVIAFWLYSCSPILTTVCSYTEVLGEKILTVFVVFPLVSPCCDAFFFFFGKGISCTTAAKPIGYVLTKGLTEGWLFLNAPKYSKWSCSHCAELCSAHFVANMHFYIWIALLPSLKECGWEPGLGPVREISTSRTPCGAVGRSCWCSQHRFSAIFHMEIHHIPPVCVGIYITVFLVWMQMGVCVAIEENEWNKTEICV